MKIERASALAAVLLVAAAGCGKGGGGGAGSSGGTVVTVNGEAVETEDFHGWLERKSVVQVAIPDQQGNVRAIEAQVAQPLVMQALRDVVQQRLLLQLAKDEGVFPTDADITKEIEFQSKRNPNFVKNYTAQGLNLVDIKNMIRLQLARDNLVTKGVTVTPDEVEEFIKKNPQQFTEPARATVVYIQVTSQEKANAADKELASGANFREVAQHFSEAPQGRQMQYQWPQDVVSRMPQKLQEIVANTAELKTSNWIKDGQNLLKFYVEKKTAPKRVDVTPEIKEIVRRSIALERGSKANDLGKRLQQKLRDSKIEVQRPGLKEQWDQAFERFQEQMGSQIPGAGGTTAGQTTAGGETAGGATAGQ